jgi:hypothetical protein
VEPQSILQEELARRTQRNPRYSLRAFARDLEMDHATLSQLLRNKRTLTSTVVRRLGAHLGMGPAAIHEACVQQDAAAILRLLATGNFRTHSRWIAQRTGIAMDQVNIALHWLLRNRKLAMHGPDRWILQPHPHA